MRREIDWSGAAIWLVLLAFAFVCGLLVIGQAFDTTVLASASRPLRISADYRADPRAARVQQIPPLESAVISDTLRDLIAEQTRGPLLGLALPTPASPTPGPRRSPTAQVTQSPRPIVAATATPKQSPGDSAPIAGPARSTPSARSPGTPRPTRLPRPAQAPADAPLPATAQPTSAVSPQPTSTTAARATSTLPAIPASTPVPPTDTPAPPTDIPASPAVVPQQAPDGTPAAPPSTPSAAADQVGA